MRIFIVLTLTVLFTGLLYGEDYEEGFKKRSDFLIKMFAEKIDPVEVMNWAIKINLGDPHKYYLPAAIARMSVEPNDPKVPEALNLCVPIDQKKGDRGLYHFSIILRTRLYFQFKDHLPENILNELEKQVLTHYFIMTGGGTENHGTMLRASAALWAEHLNELSIKHNIKPQFRDGKNASWAKEWLRSFVKQWYSVGQGEYDSSTYAVYTAAAFANVYDFSKDPELRSIVRAALDYLSATQAQKYFYGCNIGPESRGFADSSVSTKSDMMSWLWFDNAARDVMTPEEKPDRSSPVVILALSKYRPPLAAVDIADKSIRLSEPMTYKGINVDALSSTVHLASKPEYYPGNGNHIQQYMIYNARAAMSVNYHKESGIETTGTILPQTSMFKLLVKDTDEVRVFGMGSGYHGHHPLEGKNPFDFYHANLWSAMMISNQWADEKTSEENNIDQRWRDEIKKRCSNMSFFAYPKAVGEPVEKNGFYFWEVNGVYIGVSAIRHMLERSSSPWEPASVERSASAWWNDRDRDGNVKENPTYRYLVARGNITRWEVRVGFKSDVIKPEDKRLERLKPELDKYQRFLITENTFYFQSFDEFQKSCSTAILATIYSPKQSSEYMTYPRLDMKLPTVAELFSDSRPEVYVINEHGEKQVSNWQDWAVYEKLYGVIGLSLPGRVKDNLELKIEGNRRGIDINFTNDNPVFQKFIFALPE